MDFLRGLLCRLAELPGRVRRGRARKGEADSRLLYELGHDLRGPMSAVLLYGESLALKDGDLSPEKRRQFLDVMLANVRRMDQMIGELLDLSRLEAKSPAVSFSEFDLAQLLGEIALRYRVQADKAGVTLHVFQPEKPVPVFADRQLIDRALSNLIDNAIRYSQPDGAVAVSLTETVEGAAVEVADNGAGISEAELPYIFQRHFRGGASREKPGSGLGLAIANEIAQLHGADLHVESTSGRGTKFLLSLPSKLPSLDGKDTEVKSAQA